MKALDTNLPSSSRRGAVRMDQDGPWSVSVAETPYDQHSYSLYIKTPTHNLTLTRTSMEIVELDVKLRQSHSSLKIPALPIAPDSLPVPPKRKSTFLNTLSRLASPTSSKHSRRPTTAGATLQSTGVPGLPPIPPHTPLASPSHEKNDPFASFMSSSSALNSDSGSVVTANGSNSPEASAASPATATTPTPSATSTALASYLTTISNIPQVRTDRVWKRFVRVRTDDLESVRVERAIKRVRSDLAAHVGSSSKDKENLMASTSPSDIESSVTSKDILLAEEPVVTEEATAAMEVDETENAVPQVAQQVDEEMKDSGHPSKEANATEATLVPDVVDDRSIVETDTAAESTSVPDEDEEALQDGVNVPPTPHATDIPSRIPRSQSAEPHKAHRFSRTYASSVPSQSGAEDTQTGDESSSSALNGSLKPSRRRKKRSDSRIPKELREPKKSHRKVVIDDFEMMRVLGKGCAGKVLLVRHKTTAGLFALKAITKRHVLAHQELQHTLTEQAVLKRMAAENRDPFVVKLWWSFHDKENLFLVMDFHPGGDLATQLARWGRLGRDRARFYAAEIVEGVEGLHAAGVIYRDLKPENILIGADGHIVLTDFGLSKEFPRKTHAAANGFYSSVPGTPQPVTPPWMKQDRNGDMSIGWPGQPIGHIDSTTTFCGTAEYLAPEVIQGLPYSYEVDWWSFGTMLYEMLTGITPFWANNHSDMYVRVLQDELQFPEDRAIDQDTKSLIRGLLQRVPSLRICEPRIKKHPYFSMIDWSHVYYKRYIPPYIPPIDPGNASDTQNFDDTFLDMEPVLDEYNDDAMDTDQEPSTDTERTDGEESNTTPSQSRSSSIRPLSQPVEEDVDVFDGYSFKGRHSVLIDEVDEEEEGSDEASEESIDEEDEDNISLLRAADQRLSPQTDAASQLEEEEGLEPKTPEARPAALPPVEKAQAEVESEEPATARPEPEQEEAKVSLEEEIRETSHVAQPREEKPLPKRKSKDLPSVEAQLPPTPPPKPTPRPPAATRASRARKERSGVPALDRYIDEDAEITEAEREEDEDWDFIEAGDGEDRNGAKGTSLFARGVVDKYRLKVFGKPSTPARNGQRVTSGVSIASSSTVADSPSPSQRRGRTPLTFRKSPREFLRAKSPPSSFSTKSARSLSQSANASMTQSATTSNANTLSATSTSSMVGLLTPSLSQSSNTFANSPSLKSKESATSMGAQSQSSDQSNGQSAVFVEASDAIRTPPQDTKQKKMKLKKYKNNAEKVLSLFSSPRQNQL